MKKGTYTASLLCLAMSGCSLYQKAIVPSFKKPNHFKYSIQAKSPHLDYDWWKNFKDKTLNGYVQLAIQHNYDYQIALKNIEIAVTYITQNESYLYPQATVTFNSSRNRSMSIFSTNQFLTNADPSRANNTGTGLAGFGQTFSLEQLFGSVTYQVDVWNQIRNAVKQSKANLASSIANSDVVKLTLITGVVNTWFQMNALESELNNLKQQLKINKKLLMLIEAQYRGHLVDITLLDAAKNQVEATLIAIKTAEKQQDIFVNTLAYLLGLTPEEFSSIRKSRSVMNAFDYANLIPAGISSKMVANRPDVQSAYFQVLSNGYLEKQMLANFLPSFNLTGNYGYASQTFSRFFSPTNIFWNYGSTLLQPIFDYKLRMSEYRQSQLQYQSAILNYKKTVINAYQEVDNALVSYQKDIEALHASQHQVSNAKETLHATSAQYQAGYKEYTIYLTEKLNYLQYENQLIAERLIVSQDVVQIYKTLGLGLCSFSIKKSA